MNDPKRIATLLLACSTLLIAGCFSWGKKPKVDQHISVQVEETFKQRWIERRGSELMKQGVAPDTARSQAIEEFRQKYEFTTAAKE
jgi:hypothetical protein